MKRVFLFLLVLVTNSSTFADECFGEGSNPKSEYEQKQIVTCLNKAIEDFEKMNKKLREKVIELEASVFGRDIQKYSNKIVSNPSLKNDGLGGVLDEINNKTKLSALIGSSISVKLKSFKRDDKKIIVDIEYKNIGKKIIDMSSSISNKEIYLMDDAGGKWLSEGGTRLSMISPNKKILTTMIFNSPDSANANVFIFKARYQLDSKSWQVTINNIK